MDSDERAGARTPTEASPESTTVLFILAYHVRCTCLSFLCIRMTDIRVGATFTKSEEEGRAVIALYLFDTRECDDTLFFGHDGPPVSSCFRLGARRKFNFHVQSNAEHLIHRKRVNSVWRIGLCAARPRCLFKIHVLIR